MLGTFVISFSHGLKGGVPFGGLAERSSVQLEEVFV